MFGFVHGIGAGLLTATLAVGLSLNPWLGAVTFVALMLNLLVAGAVGATIPLGLKKLGADPALASSIWLTTFTDMFGFACLLGLGTLFVSHLQ